MSHRAERVGDLLRHELAQIVQREVKDPRVGLATVANVAVSRDLSHAVVHVSVLGDEEARQASLAALQRASGFIRSQLASRLRLRIVPELAWKLDRGAEYSQRISDLLESLDDETEST